MYEVVMKLVGPVEAVGDHWADQERLANIKALTDLVDRLVGTISCAAEARTREEASMKAIGKHADDFIRELHDACAARP